MESGDLQDLENTLAQHWGVPASHDEKPAWEALVQALTRRVDYLMRHDFERLLSGVYMVDVSEEQFAKAVSREPEEKPARAIAELILAREFEKLKTRKQYTRAQENSALPPETHDNEA